MRIGILGAGNIGSNAARLFASAGHDVAIGFSRDFTRLTTLANEVGARPGTPSQIARESEIVLLSVPWAAVDDALAAAGPGALDGRTVIDTTNQFGRRNGALSVLDLGESTAAEHNAGKVPAAAWVKAFNTLTAGFLADAAGRTGPNRVALFYATNDPSTTATVEALINDAGFDPIHTGNLTRTEVGHQEPKGDLYGEEFHHDEALELVGRLRGTPPSGRGRP